MHLHVAARGLAFGDLQRCVQDVGDGRPLGLEAHRPDEVEHLDTVRVRHLRLVDDVGQDRLRVRRVGHLPPQQARHDLDAGQRVLQLVRDRRGHLAERGEPVAQALALLELLDAREVLEEQRDAADASRASSRTCDSV